MHPERIYLRGTIFFILNGQNFLSQPSIPDGQRNFPPAAPLATA